jgi:tryptophan-rich sensory protein
MKRQHAQWLVLALFLLLVFATGALGSIFTAKAIPAWYADLHRPSWSPPNWLFGPVWTVLYILMAVAVWLVWRKGGSGARPAILLWAVQLVLNGVWTPIFFGLHEIGWALADIVALWAAIGATAAAFRRVSRPAAGLMLPYLAWVTFATVINYALWRMN